MMLRTVRCIVVLITFAFSANAFAQVSASSIAKRLEDQLLSGAGVSMKFTILGEGPVSIIADLKDKKIRLESSSMLVISNGSTIWNYQKHSDRVTIDNVPGTSSPMHDPKSLFQFTENYSATIAQHHGSMYRLELTPSANLRSFMDATGEMQKLSLDLDVQKKDIRIVKATAESSRGTSQISALAIKPIKSIRSSDFIFTPPPGVKILDLRE
ncbi:MAG TPA: hypothetical protein VG537_08005 [Candidatus Kapabacteria bacterium]|nr:hypothetical protein [Candidatus Kapabacteria bacterium]